MERNELKIFIAMSRTLNEVNRQTNEICRKYNLTTGQFAVLEALFHKGDLSVGEIQEYILSTTGNMPVLIRNLKDANLIDTYKSKKDKRRTMVSLTDKGLDVISSAFPENKEVIEAYFSIISKKDQIKLLEILSDFKKK